MSLVDRQHVAKQAAASQTAPAAPVIPVAPPPASPPPVQAPEAKPYKHLVVIAAVLVLVAVVTSCAILFARNQSPKGTTAPPPATAVPSSSPTLTAKQQAAAEAIDRYTAYVKAVDESAIEGSPKAVVDKLANEFSVDPLRTFTIESGERGRAGKYSSTGYRKVTARADSITSLSAKIPVATLTTCEDRTGVTIRKGGKPIPRTFQFVKSTVTMKRVDEVWKVANINSPNEPNRKSCTI